MADDKNCYSLRWRSDTPPYKSNAPMDCRSSKERVPVPLHLQTMVGSGLFRSEAIVPRYETQVGLIHLLSLPKLKQIASCRAR